MINISKLYCGLAGVSDALRYPTHRTIKPIVVFNCTPRCNLRCVHCYSSSEAACREQELTTAQAKMLIDQIAAFGCPVLLFSGGEPLLREDLFELMEYARQRKLRTVLSTNGTRITESVAEQLAELGLSYAGISLDGPQDVHDRFRRVDGAFLDTLNGIAYCRKAGIRTGLRFTMTRNNIEYVKNVFDIAATAGVRRICFYHLIRTGRAKELTDSLPLPQQVRQAVDTILACTVERVGQGVVEEVLTVGNHADGPYLLMRMQAENHPNQASAAALLARSAGNRIGQNIASVNWDGQVFPDQFWRNYSLGNILERPFGEIWQDETDPVLGVLRNKRDYKDPKCGRCRWFELCLGNFRSLNGSADLADWQNEPPCYLTEQEISRTE
ncbi:MAG: radical SAM protein [Planctomycetes bacterium]|nr:radical SAM protein [Planctomycetota bacterium]